MSKGEGGKEQEKGVVLISALSINILSIKLAIVSIHQPDTMAVNVFNYKTKECLGNTSERHTFSPISDLSLFPRKR